MDEPELLLHRFIDNELTADERLQFLRTLDHDKALRRSLLDLEGLIADLSQLPRLIPPADFTAEVRRGLSNFQPGAVELIWNAMMAPRVFRWNIAGAVAVGLAVLFVAWLLMHRP